MIALFGFASCSTAPSGPQPGTPAFYWQAATETSAARDYLKAVDHLGRLTRTEGEFTSRALPWRLVLTAGLPKAYYDLGEEFDSGAKANIFKPMPLRRVMSDYRTLAERRVMEFGEAFIQFALLLPEGRFHAMLVGGSQFDGLKAEIREVLNDLAQIPIHQHVVRRSAEVRTGPHGRLGVSPRHQRAARRQH